MHFLDLMLPTPEENLALDEAMLVAAEETGGGETLRVWESATPFVVLGYFCRLADDVDEVACRADGVPILRRVSGGGTVLQGPGCLNFAVVLDMRGEPALRDIGRSHRIILGKIAGALAPRFSGIEFHPPNDLSIACRKFSGNAQRRRRDWLLHHGTLLYDFPLASVARCLREPQRRPDYRASRRHDDFLMNLATDREWLVARLRETWHADPVAADWPRALTAELVASRYANPEWIRRR
ncbi:MAG: lipoate--protein ligase family protein [Verrucomicrobia bacterium]|nr:lipoate--protein ligase family protein [Verrucomicrobiota bacterium]